MSAQIDKPVTKAGETKTLGESSSQIDTLSEIPIVLSKRSIKDLTKVLDALKQCRVKKDNYALPTPELALRRASAAGKTEVVKILLEFVSDLDINQPSFSGQRALTLAMENNKLDIVNILQKTIAHNNPITSPPDPLNLVKILPKERREFDFLANIDIHLPKGDFSDKKSIFTFLETVIESGTEDVQGQLEAYNLLKASKSLTLDEKINWLTLNVSKIATPLLMLLAFFRVEKSVQIMELSRDSEAVVQSQQQLIQAFEWFVFAQIRLQVDIDRCVNSTQESTDILVVPLYPYLSNPKYVFFYINTLENGFNLHMKYHSIVQKPYWLAYHNRARLPISTPLFIPESEWFSKEISSIDTIEHMFEALHRGIQAGCKAGDRLSKNIKDVATFRQSIINSVTREISESLKNTSITASETKVGAEYSSIPKLETTPSALSVVLPEAKPSPIPAAAQVSSSLSQSTTRPKHAGPDKIPRTLVSRFCRAAKDDDIKTLKELINRVDVNAPYDRGVTALHFACSAGKMDAVFYLLSQGGNLHQVDTYNPPRTPMSLLSQENEKQLIDYYIKLVLERSRRDAIEKNDVKELKYFEEVRNLIQKIKNTPQKSLETFRLYFKKDISKGLIIRNVLIFVAPDVANIIFKTNECHLHAGRGDLKAFKEHSYSGSILPDIFGLIPLYDAIRNDQSEIINYHKCTLKIGAETVYRWKKEGSTTYDFTTLLHQCTFVTDIHTLKKLVSMGVNLLLTTSTSSLTEAQALAEDNPFKVAGVNSWPIMEAIHSECEESITAMEILYDPKMTTIFEDSGSQNYLIHNISAGNQYCVEKFNVLIRLGQKRNINVIDDNGHTPLSNILMYGDLHYYCSHDDLFPIQDRIFSAARVLLTNGANINLLSSYNTSIIRHGQQTSAKRLTLLGLCIMSAINNKNDESDEIYQYFLKFIQFLVLNNAKFDIPDDLGRTDFEKAQDDPNIFKMFTERLNLSKKLEDSKGQEPLSTSTKEAARPVVYITDSVTRDTINFPSLVLLLEQCKTSEDGKNLPDPELALRRAAKSGNIEIVKKLLALVKDININQAGFSGKNALMIAEEYGQKVVYDFLIEKGAKKLVKDTSQRFI